MSELLLHWPDPAAEWTEAMPIGNGRLGAMVFGGPGRTRIQVNDATVWSGTPFGPAEALRDVVAAGAGPGRLAEVRAAIRARDYRRAEALVMAFEGPYSQEFLPYVDLWLTLPDGVHHSRTLNIDSGVTTETLTVEGHEVVRTAWVSRPAQALCVSVVSSGPIDLGIELTTPLREVARDGLDLGIEIPIDGAPRHEPQVPEPHRYGFVDGYDPFGAVAVRVDTDGVLSEGRVTGMTRALITVSSSTSAADVWIGAPARSRAEHHRQAATLAERALSAGAENLRADHESDLRALLSTCRLRLAPTQPVDKLRQGAQPVDKLRRGEAQPGDGLREFETQDVAELLAGGDDRRLAVVLFQYGRYLLASASRPGAPPANLQGIWNDDPRPAWSSNYTININTQMNYWAAETTGLGECHQPLFDLLDKLAVTGADVARELYGARGWVAHHNTDPWGWALPVGMGRGQASWAIWQMGGAWLVQHAWDHYEFTRDRDFLARTAWPLLRGCTEFFLDWLVEGPDGILETCPSTSPENLFVSEPGQRESLTYSSTMDIALIRAVFMRALAAAEALGLDDPIWDEIATALPRLRPLPITDDGRLQEWAEDLLEDDQAHRHLSHLVTVYPLGQIDPGSPGRLAVAAEKVLDRRGPGAMGWSWAWKIALRARLGDGDTALSLLREASQPFTGDRHRDAPVDGSEWGGLLPNLFSTHPPFQIDGNYGFPAGIAEMLVQSHSRTIVLLPALPGDWPDGEIRGVRCRGGLAVDLEWRDGEPDLITVTRIGGDPDVLVHVRFRCAETEFRLAVGEAKVLKGLRQC